MSTLLDTLALSDLDCSRIFSLLTYTKNHSVNKKIPHLMGTEVLRQLFKSLNHFSDLPEDSLGILQNSIQ